MWGTLDSDTSIYFITLQLDSTVNSAPHKYCLKFPMSHLTAAASPTKLCLEFYSGDTVDIKCSATGRSEERRVETVIP